MIFESECVSGTFTFLFLLNLFKTLLKLVSAQHSYSSLYMGNHFLFPDGELFYFTLSCGFCHMFSLLRGEEASCA